MVKPGVMIFYLVAQKCVAHGIPGYDLVIDSDDGYFVHFLGCTCGHYTYPHPSRQHRVIVDEEDLQAAQAAAVKIEAETERRRAELRGKPC